MKELKELGFYFDNLNNGNSVYSREYVEGSLNFVSFNLENGIFISGAEDNKGNLISENHHDSFETMLKAVGV
jgi:hypothetical protein